VVLGNKILLGSRIFAQQGLTSRVAQINICQLNSWNLLAEYCKKSSYKMIIHKWTMASYSDKRGERKFGYVLPNSQWIQF